MSDTTAAANAVPADPHSDIANETYKVTKVEAERS